MNSGKAHAEGLGRLIFSGLASLLALGCLHWRTLHFPRTISVAFAEYLFIICASIAVIGFLPEITTRVNLRRLFAARGAVHISAAILFCLVLRLGTYQFGGFDESGIVHAAA
jgi:hypothetical protein